MRVAILGFGVEGKDAAKYFIQKKAEVTVFDQKVKGELDILGFETYPITWVLGENYLSGGLPNFDLIVRSPGIRPDLPEITKAIEQGAKLTSTTKIFFEECKKPIIGITGTKGKGTTASLITEALKACGKKVVLLGNIGEPMIASLSPANESDYVVLELSSFQTMDLTKSPHIAVVTNITEDHMDWHKDRQEYENAKAKLWANQTQKDFLVINEDDPTSLRLAKGAKGKVVTYNAENTKAQELIILGKHNVYNANAALQVIKVLGEDEEKAWEGIRNFPGLEHRLEKVAEVNGVLYINDSYATNPEPTLAAIRSFNKPKILILGGSSKGADFTQMANEMSQSQVKAVVLIGDESENIKRSLIQAQFKGEMSAGGKTMTEMVNTASKFANEGDVVLLSPACASFGLFQNYKDRGKQFKDAVKSLTAS